MALSNASVEKDDPYLKLRVNHREWVRKDELQTTVKISLHHRPNASRQNWEVSQHTAYGSGGGRGYNWNFDSEEEARGRYKKLVEEEGAR